MFKKLFPMYLSFLVTVTITHAGTSSANMLNPQFLKKAFAQQSALPQSQSSMMESNIESLYLSVLLPETIKRMYLENPPAGLQQITREMEDSSWVPKEKQIIYYNTDGFPSKQEIFSNDSESWVKMATIEGVVGEDGKVQQFDCIFSDEENGEAALFTIDFSYTNGLISQCINKMAGEQVGDTVSTVSTLEYNEQNQLVRIVTTMKFMGIELPYSEIVFTWKNDLLEQIVVGVNEVLAVESYANTEQELFSYNEAGRLSSVEYSVWENEEWMKMSKQIYGYSEQGEVNERIDQVYSGEKWVNEHKEVSVYGEIGVLADSAYGYLWDGTSWVLCEQIVVTREETISARNSFPQKIIGKNLLTAQYSSQNHTIFIQYSVPKNERVSLSILDLKGKKIAEMDTVNAQGTGNHDVVWNLNNTMDISIGAGRYLVKLETSQTRLAVPLTLVH